MRVLKEKNKSRNKPQWLKDWCSTKSGLGKRSKFKVYSYGELFSPQKSRKLSTKYLETVEENMETYSTNPRFIRLSSLPKQVHFADNKPKKRKRVTKSYIYECQTYAVNQAKWKAADEWCKDRKIEFKIITEKELGIR